MTSKSFWIAFISGITAGAVTALLFAPADGETTRKKIGEAYDDAEGAIEDAGEYLKDQAERLGKEATSTYNSGVKQLDDAYEKAAAALNDAYSDAKDKLGTAAGATSDALDSASKKARKLV